MFTFGSEKQHRILVLTYTCAQLLSHVQLFETPWTVTRQAPLSMGFPRLEYWSELPSPSPGGLPNTSVKPASLVSPVLADGFFTTAPPGTASL